MSHNDTNNSPPSSSNENDGKRDLLADSENERLSEKDGSDYNEEKDDSDDENDAGEGGDDNGVDSGDDVDPETRIASRNARAPAWQPWQDRLLITQVNADRPFLAALRLELVFYSVWRGMQGSFQVLEKEIEARSLQKTGTDEEIDEFMELLGDLCSLLDAESTTTENSRKKIDLEAQAGLELRDASMRGLVRGENLVDVATLPGASARERQGQRGKKRKNRDDDKENRSESRNAASKRRRRRNTELDDLLNRRIEEDKAALEACSKQDAEKHTQQMDVLNKLVDCVQGLNNRIPDMQGEQENMNFIPTVVVRRDVNLAPGRRFAPVIHHLIINRLSVKVFLQRWGRASEVL
ncbi:hypothetical protein B0H13DRAFT_2345118 [Mycena leptocephala]|nr:hypothetical protein B0H13DRAFT_2345118 [Mycena leptocephala]